MQLTSFMFVVEKSCLSRRLMAPRSLVEVRESVAQILNMDTAMI